MSAEATPQTPEGMPRGPVIVSGHPSAEEVAAIVALLVAASGSGDQGQGTTATAASGWGSHRRAVGDPVLGHGRGRWRASAQPR